MGGETREKKNAKIKVYDTMRKGSEKRENDSGKQRKWDEIEEDRDAR